MSSISRRYGKSAFFALACFASMLATHLHAQGTIQHALTPADQASVQRYILTEDAYQKLLTVAKDAKENKVPINIVDPGAHSLAETAADLDKSPAVHALLIKHGLTAREFLLGEYALLGAEFAVKYPDQHSFDASLANPANIALFRQHEAEIDALSGDNSDN